MIKLTHESVGKVYVDGDGHEWEITGMVRTSGEFLGFHYVHGKNVLCLYNEQGRDVDNVENDDYALISEKEYTPVRPIEEVMADMVGKLKYHKDTIVNNYEGNYAKNEINNSIKALLAEVQALGVVE